MFKSHLIPNNYDIVAKSLIDFKVASKEPLKKSDWIFFTSKNAVKYFFALGYKIDNQKIACAGSGTYKVLSAYTSNIAFVGNQVDTNKSALEFKLLAKNSTCLFPISNISRRTFQKAFETVGTAIDVVVYNTSEKEKLSLTNDYDILIFTSPSNVRSYFNHQGRTTNSVIIAMGKSTGAELSNLGIKNYKIPKISGEIGLIDCLLNI